MDIQENKENKKLLLITIGGCEGCKIMKNILTKHNIDFETKDINDVRHSDIIKTSKKPITDFPTLCFIKNNIIIETIIGSKPFDYIDMVKQRLNF